MEGIFFLDKRRDLPFLISFFLLGVFVSIFNYFVNFQYFLVFLFCFSFALFFFFSPKNTILFYIIIINFLFPVILFTFHKDIEQIEIVFNLLALKDESRLRLRSLLEIILFFVGIIYILVKKIRILKLPISFPFILFISSGVISFFFSIAKTETLKEILHISILFLLYILVFELFKNKMQIRKLLLVMLFPVFGHFIIGLLLYLKNIGDFISGYIRIYSTFFAPNMLAHYLMICFCSIMVILFSQKERLIRFYITIITILAFILLYLTYSRGGWIGLYLIILVFSFLMQKKRLFWLTSMCIVLVFLLFNPFIKERIKSLFFFPSGLIDQTVNARFYIWKNLLPSILSNPLLGKGWATARFYTGECYGNIPHNQYLRFLAEGGILSLTLYLWLIFILFKQAFFLFKNSIDPFFKNLGASYLALLFSWILISIFEDMFSSYMVAPYFIVLGAVVNRGLVITIKEKKDESSFNR